MPCSSSGPWLGTLVAMSRNYALRGRNAALGFDQEWSLVNEPDHDLAVGDRCADHGDLAPRQARQPAAPPRPGQPVQLRAVPAPDGRSWHHLLNEPVGQRLGQCGNGELLLLA